MKKFTLILLLFGCFITCSKAQNLVSISPNSASAGQTLTTTITGNNTMFQSSSPQGNLIDVNLQLGSNILAGDFLSITVADDLHFDIDFSIPAVPIPGIYDLNVTSTDNWFGWYTISLPQSFTVGTINGYISGQVYDDLNKNGIKDVGEPGISGQQVSINPYNYSVVTDNSGNYSFAVPNGSYTISYVNVTGNYKFLNTASPLSVTINNNNSPGNDFGVYSGLTSVSPSAGIAGQTIQFLVVSEDSVFRTNANPYGNITSAGITGAYSINANLTTGVTVLSWDSALVTITIPGYFPVGDYTFRVNTSSPYAGTHQLNNAFTLGAAQSYISGKVYFDANANGIYDSGDVGLTNRKVIIQPDNIIAYSGNGGNYNAGIYNGVKTVTYASDPYYVLSSTPASYSVSASNNTYPNKDFGFVTGIPFYDAFLHFSGWPRCNTNQSYSLYFQNNSNTPVSGTAYVVTSPNMTYLSATPVPSSISGDTLFFNFSAIPINGYFTASIIYAIPSAGSTISYAAHVDVVSGASVVYSKDYSRAELVRCSFDPNDKACTPAGVQDENYTLMSDKLVYKVRFQNTGNDTAYVVRVFDVLDPDLDWSTFRMEGSSHSVTTALNLNTGLVIFTFNNIMLVDSTTNEPGSNGYVMYSMQVDSGLTDYTPITNTADIYFDGNTPVTTNTTTNTMVYVIPVGLNEIAPEQSQCIIIPNPVKDHALIRFDNLANDSYQLKIYDIKGSVLLNQKVNTGNVLIDLHKLSKGLFMYQLIPLEEGKTFSGKFVVE